MDTTELFKFPFVDRKKEQEIFEAFLNNSHGEALWIYGKHGIGKTQLVSYLITPNTYFTYAYYNIKENSSNEEIFAEFLNMIQEKGEINFFDFVKKSYKAFYDNFGQQILDITTIAKPNISDIISKLLDSTNYILNHKNERRENIDIIEKYIAEILKTRRLFICVDNFSRCSKETIIKFCDIFKTFLNEANCRICLITANEDFDDNKRLQIREMIPNKVIVIERFKEYKFFHQIIESIFDTKELSQENIEYIYNKCNGEPQKLSILISKLLDKDGILHSKGKRAHIKINILNEILKDEYIHFNPKDLNPAQRWILFSFLCLYNETSIKDVEELAMFISKHEHLFNAYNKERFYEELNKLIENKFLFTDGEILSTNHDLDYIDFMDIFIKSNMYSLFAKNAYEFLLDHSVLGCREDLICRNMRNANIPEWEKRNYLYGEKLFNQHQYFDAKKIFDYLVKEYHSLSPSQLLTIAINEYEVGNFGATIDIMEKFVADNFVDSIDKFNWTFYWGKSIYNFKTNISDAIIKLKEAKDYVEKNSREYLMVQNLLQMYYIEVPGHYKDAFSIFNEIREEYKESHPDVWASTMRGCHNYLQDEDALSLLEEATLQTNDKLECAYIETTKGFVYARMGDMNSAKTCFDHAYKAIKIMKRHEASYAANNLAICYMMEENYFEAKDILLDALFLNKTNYGKIVIRLHLMVCETFLKNTKDAEAHIKYLEDYMERETPRDDVMQRKVLMNLAVVNKELGNNMLSQKCISDVEKYAIGTPSEWRYSVLKNNSQNKKPDNIYYGFSTFDPWFLVYAHD